MPCGAILWQSTGRFSIAGGLSTRILWNKYILLEASLRLGLARVTFEYSWEHPSSSVYVRY